MEDHKNSASLRVVGFIGGYLIDDGVLTLEQLDRALQRQIELGLQGQVMLLGQVLILMGLVTPDQLERALKRQAEDRKRLGVPAGTR